MSYSQGKMAGMLRVATFNVNGIRAARRRGMHPWLAERRPDLLCLQEVRASDSVLVEVLGDGWHGVHEESSAKGRAGVAVLSARPLAAVRAGFGGAGAGDRGLVGEFHGSGRWVEADIVVGNSDDPDDLDDPPDDPNAPGGDGTSAGQILTIISAYVHTGEAETPRQEQKYRFLAAVRARLLELAAEGRQVLLCGDLNIAHQTVDLKNWKANVARAGFLPEERAWLDRLLREDGFVDVHRTLAGQGPGPYTWWSWRGKAFDTDAGWRIDYQIATPALAALAAKAEVDRARSYAERVSDHAPLVIDYGGLQCRHSGSVTVGIGSTTS